MATGRATIIDVAAPFAGEAQAAAWLSAAGEDELSADLAILNRAMLTLRAVSADPYLNAVSRGQLLVARVGYGAGEQVADGLWADARELLAPRGRQRRAAVLHPQARLAAVLGGRERTLVCEELVLRARLDLDQQREREAALQVRIALDAALAELPTDPAAAALKERLEELRALQAGVAAAAEAALRGALGASEREAVAFALGRIEAVLRARDAAFKE